MAGKPYLRSWLILAGLTGAGFFAWTWEEWPRSLQFPLSSWFQDFKLLTETNSTPVTIIIEKDS